MKKILYVLLLAVVVIGGTWWFLNRGGSLDAPSALRDLAGQLCDGENVDRVEISVTMIRVVSKLLGGGSTYYRADGSQLSCPLVAPGSERQECKDAEVETRWETVCRK